LGRRAWRRVTRYHAEPSGPYRETKIVVDRRDRAPALVRVAAFTCIVFGQMFVPGAFGIDAFMSGVARPEGLGAVLGFPGLVVAGALWATGYALLLRRPRRHALARFAVRAGVALNTAILFAYALDFCFGVPEPLARVVETFLVPELAAITILYALLSLGQAALLRAALRIEDESTRPHSAAPQLPRWLVRLLLRKRSRAAV
jgi:hypothetical protein